MNKKSKSKEHIYKEWILKSGFPLENEVLRKINQFFPTSKIDREFEFQSISEDGSPNIRSLDFVVTLEKDTKNIPHRNWRRARDEKTTITLLIDAKYSQDEHLLFTPSYKKITERCWPSLIPMLCKDEFNDDVTIYRDDFKDLSKILTNIASAGAGRKVKEQSRERNSIASMALQSFQGLSNFLKVKTAEIGKTSDISSHYNRNAHFFFPIIVTNAPLLLIHDQITIKSIEDSNDISEVCSEKNHLILDMPNIYDLKEDWNQLKNAYVYSDQNKLKWLENTIIEGSVLVSSLSGLDYLLKEVKKAYDSISVE
tara:strand:- start:138230 stop:139165 length:936 start_codon:yes stop_codon:yes gene_type:complete